MNVEKHLVFLVLFLLESRALVTETNLDAKEVFRFEKEIPSLQIDNEIHEIGWVWLINPENVLNIKCQLWQNDNVTDIAEYAHKGDKYVTHLYELGEFVGYFDSNKLVLHKLPPSLEGADLHICVTYTVRSFEFESVCAKYAQLKSTLTLDDRIKVATNSWVGIYTIIYSVAFVIVGITITAILFSLRVFN